MASESLQAVALSAGECRGAKGAFLPRCSRADAVVAIACATVAFVVYFITMAPTITAEDAGELASAAWTLGVPHPPGYPLYVVLGKVFMTLVPFGEKAFRLNLFSAFLGATATGLVTLLCLRLAASRAGAIAAGLVAAFTPVVWSQATIIEVYTLAAVVLLAIVHVTLSYLFEPRASVLLILSYLFGLALAAHPSMVLLGPGLVATVVIRDFGIFKRPVWISGAAVFCALGFSVFLYLPLRSLADPIMDWGNPETLQGFVAHLLRMQYEGLGEPPARPVLDRVLYLGHIVVFEVGPVLVLLGLLGLGRLLTFPGKGSGTSNWPSVRVYARFAFRIGYLLWLACFSLGLLFFITVSFQAQTVNLNSVFFVPLVLLLAPAAALGIDRLGSWLESRAQAWWEGRSIIGHARFVTAVVFPLALLLVNFSSQDRSQYTIGRDYAEAILKTLPKDAVYVPCGDHANFAVLYLQLVEGLRPDVVVADKYGYLDPRVLERIGATPEEIANLEALPRAQSDRWLIDNCRRPVFVNSKRSILEIPTERFLPVGVLYRVDRERRPLSREEEDALWASYRFGNLDAEYHWSLGARDMAADFIVTEVVTHRAETLYRHGEKEKAVRALEYLAEVGAPYREVLQNTGTLLGEWECYDRSAAFYGKALALDPDYALCSRNYARVLLRAGRTDAKTLETAEKSLAELPPDGDFMKLLGKAYRKERRYQNACDAFMGASRLEPNDFEPYRLVGEVWETDLKVPAEAKKYFTEALKRKPTQPDLIEKLNGKAARDDYEARARKALDEMVRPHLPAALSPSLPNGMSGDKAAVEDSRGGDLDA